METEKESFGRDLHDERDFPEWHPVIPVNPVIKTIVRWPHKSYEEQKGKRE